MAEIIIQGLFKEDGRIFLSSVKEILDKWEGVTGITMEKIFFIANGGEGFSKKVILKIKSSDWEKSKITPLSLNAISIEIVSQISSLLRFKIKTIEFSPNKHPWEAPNQNGRAAYIIREI